ncbi:hypothetical protein C8R48DRAFT_743831, partial [Suillus tomentosus]
MVCIVLSNSCTSAALTGNWSSSPDGINLTTRQSTTTLWAPERHGYQLEKRPHNSTLILAHVKYFHVPSLAVAMV